MRCHHVLEGGCLCFHDVISVNMASIMFHYSSVLLYCVDHVTLLTSAHELFKISRF